MAQAKKKTATKTSKKTTCAGKKSCCKSAKCEKCKSSQGSNMFFVISMTVLATTLLFANLLIMNF